MCINLAEESGKLIRSVYASGALESQEKDLGEGPVTIADLKVQKTIEYNLKQLYPTLEIQGEEDPSMYSKYEPFFLPE